MGNPANYMYISHFSPNVLLPSDWDSMQGSLDQDVPKKLCAFPEIVQYLATPPASPSPHFGQPLDVGIWPFLNVDFTHVWPWQKIFEVMTRSGRDCSGLWKGTIFRNTWLKATDCPFLFLGMTASLIMVFYTLGFSVSMFLGRLRNQSMQWALQKDPKPRLNKGKCILNIAMYISKTWMS